MTAAKSAKRVLAIVGPTASGKSEVAIRLAEQLHGDIISCDSVAVYRNFDIGSAKPTPAERRRAVHHLVDVVDWCDPFDAASYAELAAAAISDIHGRGRTAILCGGTGLYMRALRWGMLATPRPDQALRDTLMTREQQEPGYMHAYLQRLDPASAQKLSPRNMHHVMRSLELTLQTGTPASALRSAHGFASERTPMTVFVLDRSLESSKQRIGERAQQMLDVGLVEEVRMLLKRGVPSTARPMKAVGYREVCAALLGNLDVSGLRDHIAHSTWQYARRQRTWFRREPDVQTCTMGDTHDICDVVQDIAQRFAK